MQTVNISIPAAPALEKYAAGPLTDLWKRPGLSPRDRIWLQQAGYHILQCPL